MASLSTNKSGVRSIQVGRGDARKTIRLGKVDRRTAERVRGYVGDIESAKRHNHPIPDAALEWAAGVSDTLHARIARAGLLPSRRAPEAAKLGPFLAALIKRRTDLKPTTLSNLNQARINLIAHFGENRDMRTITRGDIGDWHRFLKGKFAQATASMHVKKAKQFFRDAVDRGVIAANPVGDLKAGTQRNPDRFHYVSEAVIEKVIAACPDAEWKLLFALARYGCLRVPSEPNLLGWADVNFATGRMTVTSPKTERAGKASRVIPIFPELLPHLHAARTAAPEGSTHVIRLRRAKCLHKNAIRVIRSAGVEPWPRLFQNLRASRETDLADRFPIHVVCQWAGNTEAVARKHYLHAHDEHFARATGQSCAASDAGSVPVFPDKTLTSFAFTGDFAGAGAGSPICTALGGGTANPESPLYLGVGRKTVRRIMRQMRDAGRHLYAIERKRLAVRLRGGDGTKRRPAAARGLA